MTMKTSDIRILALLTGLDPKFLSEPDDKLLALVYHECTHLYLQGEYKKFYDSLPNDVAIRFMVDRRTLEWMLATMVPPRKPTLAERLEHGATADLWTDYADGCHDTAVLIDRTQAAMLEAAKLLREHGLDK
jgi:hypothetical protein